MADQIDLSAGLKPKIDLSAGLVSKDTPTNAPSAPASPLITAGEGQYQMRGKDGKPVPVSYSHVLDSIKNGYNFVNRSGKESLAQFAADHAADKENHANEEMKAMSNWNPLKYLAAIGAGVTDVAQGIGGEALKTATAFDKPSTSRLETELQIAAETPAQNPIQAISGLGEQVGEFATAPETDLAKAAKVGKAAKTAIKVGEQGVRAAAEQGGQAYVKSGGDTEEAKRGAEVGGAAGAVAPFGQMLFNQGGRLLSESLGQRFDIDPFSVGKRLRKLDDETALVHEENVKKIKEAKGAEQAANAKRVPGTDYSHSEGKEVLRSAALEHEDAAATEKAALAKQQILSDGLSKARQAVMDRVQRINQAAKDYFKKGFDDVKAKLDAPDEAGEVHTVPYADLDADVEAVEKEIKGSKESVKIFQDIGKKAQGVGDSGIDEEDLALMAPDERRAAMQLPSAKYSDLDGYYQEAGRAIGNPSTLPDVRQALVKFRELLGKRMQNLADEVDPAIGKQHKLLRAQYREYAEGFKDYTGPAGSGSPIALGLQAKDADNATEKYLKLSPEEAKRTKRLLVGDTAKPETQFTDKEITGPDGKPQPAWKYRKQTHQLIEHMRNLRDGLDKATEGANKATTDTAESASNLAKARTAVRNLQPVKKAPLPTMTPTELRQFKVDTLANLSHNLGKFGTWVAIGGLIGGASGLIRGITGGKGAEGTVEESLTEAGAGVAMGLITPHYITKLLNQPGVVESLTRLSKSDLTKLMALPPAQRGPTEQVVKMLADEAVREGKLSTRQIPWYRIIGGTAARNLSQPPPPESSGESEEDIQKDLDQMQQSVAQ